MRGMFLIGSTIAVVLLGLVLGPSDGHADFYKWVDEEGTVWLTDDPESLPEESEDEVEKVMVIEKGGETPPQEGTGLRDTRESEGRSSAESYLAKEERLREERSKLREKIADLETDLGAARSALNRVALTDRRGYWFVIDSETGSRVPASYRDPGAIWSTQTWPALPRSAWTKESDERRKIEADIDKFEAQLRETRAALAQLSGSP